MYLFIPRNLTETLTISRVTLSGKHSFIVFDDWIVAINGLETTRKEVIVYNLRYHPINCLPRLRRVNRNLRRDSKWLYPNYKDGGTAIPVQAWTGP